MYPPKVQLIQAIIIPAQGYNQMVSLFTKQRFFKRQFSPSSQFKLSCSSPKKEAAATLLPLLAPSCSSKHHNMLESPTKEDPAHFLNVWVI